MTSIISGIAIALVIILIFMIYASPWTAFGAAAGWLASWKIQNPWFASLVSLLMSAAGFWASLSATVIILADRGLAIAPDVIGIVAFAGVLLALPWYLLEATLIWKHKRRAARPWRGFPVQAWPAGAPK